MGFVSKLLKVNGMVLLGGTGLTVYAYPELREDPHQLVRAMFRSMRCAKAGTLMAYDYLNVSLKKHPDQESLRLCFIFPNFIS